MQLKHNELQMLFLAFHKKDIIFYLNYIWQLYVYGNLKILIVKI